MFRCDGDVMENLNFGGSGASKHTPNLFCCASCASCGVRRVAPTVPNKCTLNGWLSLSPHSISSHPKTKRTLWEAKDKYD